MRKFLVRASIVVIVAGAFIYSGYALVNFDPALKPFAGVGKPIRPNLAVPGLTPAQIKAAYHISGGGSGTIAIIDAYDDPAIGSDLATFDRRFGLKTCSVSNGCLEIHPMAASIKTSTDWSGETSLDVEWAHAIAPDAKILLVEATSASRSRLLRAVDYARGRSDVVAVSMSWGGDEFAAEPNYEKHFASATASFFASSGDDGHGVSWPAASPQVIAVGGTTLDLSTSGAVRSETAWSGSGGGKSSYLKKPSYQVGLNIHSGDARAVPDVAFNANPNTGYSVYDSFDGSGWLVVGGTSAGAPQWAALKALDHNLSLASLYASGNFRDITKGSNGSCGSVCNAKAGYDFVTGLGSPSGGN